MFFDCVTEKVKIVIGLEQPKQKEGVVLNNNTIGRKKSIKKCSPAVW